MFNKKIDGYELDIYIPSLSIAIELNGITHYKPIYGDEKFKNILYCDNERSNICKKNNIRLFIINISEVKISDDINCDMVYLMVKEIIENNFEL